ncbi:thiaminase II [Sphingobacterium daejeonense]|uniref:thiaminase II n=1 Tax=Sphingobacterium daejeonense TaxID=371142 RepID=UPI0021A96168|nr:thiaminase II [Sphingobacterium daejeonense]MCT1529902.1 thiaminase II [Sphingobacterium daejeonense]
MNWTEHAWQSIQPLFQEILEMPFIQELKDGTLPLEKFQFYMLQDAKYLEHYGRALAALGSKAMDNKMALDFFDFGKNALVVESALHEAYFEQFGLQAHQEITIEPICHHYIHFLKSTVAFDPIEVATAAILPCFWIYKEVGDHILETQNSSNNPYKNWIDTYSGDEFAEGVKLAIAYTDYMAENSTEEKRKLMLAAFKTASKLEFMFWDAAYKNTKW